MSVIEILQHSGSAAVAAEPCSQQHISYENGKPAKEEKYARRAHRLRLGRAAAPRSSKNAAIRPSMQQATVTASKIQNRRSGKMYPPLNSGKSTYSKDSRGTVKRRRASETIPIAPASAERRHVIPAQFSWLRESI
jgi:hypothetical protein